MTEKWIPLTNDQKEIDDWRRLILDRLTSIDNSLSALGGSGNTTINITEGEDGIGFEELRGILNNLGLTPLQNKGDLLTHDGTVSQILAVGSDDQVLTADSSASNGIKWADLSSGDYDNMAIFEQQVSAGTHGGTASSGWNTRQLNTSVLNNISGCSINTGTYIITLPAGTYYAFASAPGYLLSNQRLRIYDTGNSTVLTYGQTGKCSLTDVPDFAYLREVFTLAAGTTIRLDHYAGSASANSQAFGSANNISGYNEIYAQLILTKVA